VFLFPNVVKFSVWGIVVSHIQNIFSFAEKMMIFKDFYSRGELVIFRTIFIYVWNVRKDYDFEIPYPH